MTPKASKTLLGVAGILSCLLASSCAGEDATQKRLAALQEELDRAQNRGDRLEERVTALEVANQKRTVHIDGDADDADRPNLKVVKLSPQDGAASADPGSGAEGAKHADDTGPRPVIRATGQGEGRIDNLDAVEASPAKLPPSKKDESDGD